MKSNVMFIGGVFLSFCGVMIGIFSHNDTLACTDILCGTLWMIAAEFKK